MYATLIKYFYLSYKLQRLYKQVKRFAFSASENGLKKK